MENAFPILIIFLYGLSIVACVFLLIYFVFKRIDDKKKEDFEEREN